MRIPPELLSSEKQPQLGFPEPAAPPCSSSTYLDMPPAPHVDNAKDDLSYISRMLMEDDIVDNLYHPMLLSAEQPFAQILSANATDIPVQHYPLQSSVATPEYYSYSDMVTSDGMHVHQDASSSLLTNGSTHEAVSSGNSSMDVISMAFYKGMEDATKLLTSKTHSETLDRDRGRKKRLQEAKDDVDDVAMGRSSKQKVVQWRQPGSEEEAAACEMLDQLMLNDEPGHAGMQRELLSSMKLEKPQGRRRGGGAGVSHTVDLHALLIQCAEAMATNDQQGAVNLLLQRIRHHSSPTGDGTQRLAHCFAQGLEARLVGTGNHMYRLLLAKCRAATSTLKVYQMYMAASSIFPVSYLLSNTVAYNKIAGRKKLHIVHYGLGHGFHLPDLLRMLSSREGGPPEVRLTGIDNPLPGFRPDQIIEETGRRLSDCARQFRVPFKFRAIAAKLEAVCAEDLDIDPDEVLVVVSHFCFKSLMDESVVVDRPNPRDTVLKNIANMRPEVFIHDVLNGSYSGAFFVPRFREALNSFAAMFDAMNAIMPQENQNRLLAEQWLATCVMNVVACEGVDRVSRTHKYKQWQARSERAGLRQLPLDPDIVQMFKIKVKEEYCKYIVINEDHQWLLTGWKGLVLSELSSLTAEDGRSGLGE